MSPNGQNDQTDAVELELPFSAASARVARDELRRWLDSHGQSGSVVEESRLVLSELVGNAVRHASPLADGTVHVSWGHIVGEADHALELAVTDGGGSTVPRRLDANASALAGRGLALVATLSQRCWTEVKPSRTTVHARLLLSEPVLS